MNALPVYATEGGRRFHAVTNCRALHSGQDLYGGWGTLRIHAVRETTISDAMGRGKEACTACFPALRAAWYRGDSENDFGHEPVYNQHFGPVCRRCERPVTHYDEAYRPSRWLRPVPWPCMSAIVLGLVPRPA